MGKLFLAFFSHPPNVEGHGSTPSQGTRFHMPQLKTRDSQINKYFKK